MDISKTALETASEIGVKVLVFWPVHDEYDYYCQPNYQGKWDVLVEAVRELAKMNSEISIGVANTTVL